MNTAALNGSFVLLDCHLGVSTIAWSFVAVGELPAVSLISNCEVLPGYADKYRVEKSDVACNLIIDELTEAHAGTYTCQDLSIADLAFSAQVIYIGTAH